MHAQTPDAVSESLNMHRNGATTQGWKYPVEMLTQTQRTDTCGLNETENKVYKANHVSKLGGCFTSSLAPTYYDSPIHHITSTTTTVSNNFDHNFTRTTHRLLTKLISSIFAVPPYPAATMPAMQYFEKAQSSFKPPLVANENAFLGDVASSYASNFS